jgi:hypothetical protein
MKERRGETNRLIGGNERREKSSVCVNETLQFCLYTDEGISVQYTNYCILKYKFKNYTVHRENN